MKTLLAFLIPGGPVFVAALGFLRPHGLPAWMQAPVGALPYIALAFGLIFGWYLASGRLILSLLVLGLVDLALVLCPPSDPDPSATGQILYAAVSFLLPLNLLALSLVREQALPTWRGVVRLCFLLAQPFMVLWLALPDHAHLARALQYPLMPFATHIWSPVPQAALLSFMGAACLLAIRFVMGRSPDDAGALWALVASFTALHGMRYGWAPTNFLSCAGLILFVTLVQGSHQRAYRDSLTGLLGKPAYAQAMAQLKGRYVLAIVGIDQLKQYGNQYGKPVSEQLLRLVAPKIQAAAGQGQVYRLAGEEFTILFPRKTAVETLVTMEAIRKSVERCDVCCRRDLVCEGSRFLRRRAGFEELNLTVSIGLAESQQDGTALAQMTKAGYRALYEAKEAGGNLIKRAGVPSETLQLIRPEMGRIVAYSEFHS